MQISVNAIDGSLVARLEGDLDIATGRDLERMIRSVADECVHVVIDLTDVTFIDCSGVRSLAALGTTVRSSGGELDVRSPSGPVHRILDLTGLTVDDLAGDGRAPPAAHELSTCGAR
jgi:stage II sporulation protein AA (anti-sigma F factor antagonist)